MRVPGPEGTPPPTRTCSSTPSAAPGAIRNLLDAAGKRRQRGLEFGLHAASGHAVRDQLPLSAAVSTGRTRPEPSITPSTSVQKDELAGAKSRCAGHRHLVGVDVVDLPLPVARHAGYHGQGSRWPSEARAAPGFDLVTRPTAPSAGDSCSASTRNASMPEKPHGERPGAV